MAYTERKKILDKIERLRGRPLIAYVTNLRQNLNVQMNPDVIPQITKQLLSIPKETKDLDFLIVSHGGDPLVSWRIVSLLREQFTKVSALIPYCAYSAATLLVLGADEILMHPFSNLGPVDPQLSRRRRLPHKEGQASEYETIHFSTGDIRHYLEFVRQDVGLTDQEQLQKSFELLANEIGTIPIGVAKRASNFALMMGERILSLHMKDESKTKIIVEALNKSFFHHGYPLHRSEVSQMGLPVKHPPEDLQNLMWELWLDYENEMECNSPFDPLFIVLKDPNAAPLLSPVSQVQMPANLPPNLMQQATKQILQQIGIITIPPVDYSVLASSLESTRCHSQARIEGKIFATRRPDMTIAVSVIRYPQKWV